MALTTEARRERDMRRYRILRAQMRRRTGATMKQFREYHDARCRAALWVWTARAARLNSRATA